MREVADSGTSLTESVREVADSGTSPTESVKEVADSGTSLTEPVRKNQFQTFDFGYLKTVYTYPIQAARALITKVEPHRWQGLRPLGHAT